jgi:hypothetical protein
MVQKRISGVTFDEFLKHNAGNSELKAHFRCSHVYDAVMEIQHKFKFHHNDIHSKNIMVQSLNDGSVVGLIDWDKAVKFVPSGSSTLSPPSKRMDDWLNIKSECLLYGFSLGYLN